MNQAGNLSYDVFVNDPPPQDGFLPNGEPKRFSPMASTLIYGNEDAVLTDPGMTEDQAHVLGDWGAAQDRNVTDIFITHGHGDHFFAAGLLAERFGARVVATAGTIAQMQGSTAARPLLWDKLVLTVIPCQALLWIGAVVWTSITSGLTIFAAGADRSRNTSSTSSWPGACREGTSCGGVRQWGCRSRC